MVNNYNKLKIKYKLPNLGKLKEALEIEVKVDHDQNLLLQSIRNDISDRLYELAKLLESVLFTGEGSDPGSMYQEEMIKSVSKEGFELYKNLNHLHYTGLRLRFSQNRKADAEFINTMFKKWPDIEKKLSVFFEAIESGWKNLDLSKEFKTETYHG